MHSFFSNLPMKNQTLRAMILSSCVKAVFEGEADPTKPPEVKTFTQDQLNSIIATTRKEEQAKADKILENAKLTEQQKAAVEAQLEESRNAGLTEKEKLGRELEKTRKESETKLKGLQEEAQLWKDRFLKGTVKTAIVTAAAEAEAYDPEQIEAIIGPSAKVVEMMDSEGKPTGTFAVKVKVSTIGSDKKLVELEMSPSDALKIHKENPKLMNLFKNTQIAGAGGANGSGAGGKKIELKDMTPSQYREQRKELLGK